MYGDIKESDKFKIIDDTLNSPSNKLSLQKLCNIAKVSRSGYYNWVNSADKRIAKDEADLEDFKLILEAFKAYGYRKGVDQIYMYFIHRDPQIVMNKKKIKRIMDKYNLYCKIRKPNYVTMRLKEINVDLTYPYLVEREFRNKGPRMVLLTDITYIIKGDIKCYLSVIKDAYTTEILAHKVSIDFDVEFVIETLEILKEKHGNELTKETIINSDQGSHYKSYRYRDGVNALELKQSMSHKATCWDNAPVESFFGHMKDEIDLTNANTFEDIKKVIDDYIEIYNTKRYQNELCRLSPPSQFYQFIINDYYPSYLQNVFPEEELKLPVWIIKYKKRYKKE